MRGITLVTAILISCQFTLFGAKISKEQKQEIISLNKKYLKTYKTILKKYIKKSDLEASNRINEHIKILEDDLSLSDTNHKFFKSYKHKDLKKYLKRHRSALKKILESKNVSASNLSDEPEKKENLIKNEINNDLKELHKRIKNYRKFGGSSSSQKAVSKALKWFQKEQNPNGSWGEDQNIGISSLVLLSFLAHGETTDSKEYGETITKTVNWLNKVVVEKRGRGIAYWNAMAVQALADSYRLTGNEGLLKTIKTGTERIIKGQLAGGGYFYYYKTGVTREDLSIFSWNYQALVAVKKAGIEVNDLDLAFKRSDTFLKTMAARDFPYTTLTNKPGKLSMRAAGVYGMQVSGQTNDKKYKEHIKNISEKDLKEIAWGNQSIYSWYYGTNAMFNEGGSKWKKWNKKVSSLLIKNQSKTGYWEFKVGHLSTLKETEKKVYTTALATLTLTVYYRYPQGYKVDKN